MSEEIAMLDAVKKAFEMIAADDITTGTIIVIIELALAFIVIILIIVFEAAFPRQRARMIEQLNGNSAK